MKVTHLFLILAFSTLCIGCHTASTNDHSPHAEAITLVMRTQGDVIRTVDGENWFHDTKSREWIAKRPFVPGISDSTQLFEVQYKIDGVVMAMWMVDTKSQAVHHASAK